MKNISTLSFGKDSMVMNDLLLKNGYPVDYIVFTDTLLEFPMMYEYKEKVTKYFKNRYSVEIITTKPESTFEDWCFDFIKSGELEGYIRGIPMVWAEPCYWRRESKIKPMDRFIKDRKISDYKIYVGFTLDEAQRRMFDDKFLYPLIDDFMMSERDCQEYLINQEMQNPLYNYFSRTGCSICPAQSEKAWFQVWKYFPQTWEYMHKIEMNLLSIEASGTKVKNKTWFSGFRSCRDMEKKFIKVERQGSLFDFSDEPLKDCFCKI